MANPFIGEIKIFAGNFAPRGYALCNGQLLQIAQNTALFSLLGTTYGGDGRTIFGLPNLQGRAAMHEGRGPGLTDRRLGQKGGVETVTLTEPQMATHTHALRASTGAVDRKQPTGRIWGDGEQMYRNAGNLQQMAAGVIVARGGGSAHNNLQPYQVLNFIIALTGLYPSRS